MGWGAGVSTGMVVLDYIMRPMLKIITKFPILGLICVSAVYATIGYHALKSAYLSDHQ